MDKKYLLFPLSLLALSFFLMVYNAGYNKFWLNTDPKGIYTMGLILWTGLLLATVVLAFLIRRLIKSKLLVFGAEFVLFLGAFLWLFIEVESLVLVLDDPAMKEFVIVYDNTTSDRLKWKLSENEISLFSLPPTITNRRRLTIENNVEITKREPSVYLPSTNFHTAEGRELEFQRMRYQFMDKDEKSHTVDYYYKGRGGKHQDSLLINSRLLASVSSSIGEKN